MAGESRSVVVRLSMDTAQALRASKEFGSEVERSMAQAEKSTGKSRAAMDQLGGTTGKMALAATAGLVAVIATTANFDEAMSHVAATGDDARGSLEELREAAIQAGADTAFSASEAAAGIENLAKAGVSADDILGGGLAGSLDLAAAGGLEVADAAEIAATALTQFKLSGEDVPHVADLLAAAAGKAQGDVSDMSMALKQSGLVASQMNLSLEETTGTLAAFASAGLLGSDAGTSFRTMLLRLANPTKESAELMAAIGFEAYDAQGKFVGMASVAEQLKVSLQDKTQAERDAALATIFGSDAIRAASVLYEQGASGIDSWTGKVDDSGYAAETAATRMDNLKGDIEQFTGSLETALIGAGEGSQGALRDMVQGATKAVNVFNDLPGPVQESATGLLAITAVTGGAAWFGAKVIGGISNTKNALDDLGYSSERVAGNLKVIGGLASAATVMIALEVAAAELIRTTDNGAPALEGFTNDLINLSNAEGIAGVTQGLGDLKGAIDTLSDPGLAAGIGAVYDKVPLVGSAFADIAPVLGSTRQEARNAQTGIDALDDSLANIVNTGSPEQAAAAFEQLAATYHLTAEEQDALRDLLPGYQEALDGQANSAELAAGATDELTGAADDMGVAQRKAEAHVQAMKDALEDERDSARKTAGSFLEFGNSLDKSKKSLGQWLHELEKQADALRDFTHNARTAAKRGLNEGLIQSLEDAGAVGALRMRQLANATDAEIKRANKAWRNGQDAIRDYVNMKVPDKQIHVDIEQATRAIFYFQSLLNGLHSKTIAIDVATHRAAGGPIVGPGTSTSDSVPVMASNGEFMMSAAAVDHYGYDTMFAMNARHLAGGGAVDGRGPRSLDDRLAVAQALEQIRQLRHDLAQDGKDKLEGLKRRIAELELDTAQRELRLAKTREARETAQARADAIRSVGDGLSFDSLVPAAEPLTVAAGVSAQILAFKDDLLDAGGTWSHELRQWARDLRINARMYDATKAALEAEQLKRDELVKTLAEQQSQLDALISTMEAFSQSVAANFLTGGFNGAHTETVDGVEDGPAAAALEAARAELAAVRSSATGDTIAMAARASQLLAQIKELELAAESESTGSEHQVSGLEALRGTLETDTQNALAFAAALDELKAKGLDTTGDMGGLFQQLAASGDLATAQELAALSAEQIDEYEKLFAAREDAAAAVAAMATQSVYGEQHAVLVEQISHQNELIAAVDDTLVVLEATLAVMGEQVRLGAGQGAQLLVPQLQAINASVKDLARLQAERRKKDRV